MHKMLYYPDFEIQNENFLKFALLYIDEISPIIPESAMYLLSDSMKMVINNTNLIKPYSPQYEDGHLASIVAIERIKNCKNNGLQNNTLHSYTLYREKYSACFQNYCLENKMGEICEEGIRINEDAAYTYMSTLAEIISNETETDIITDNEDCSDLLLKYPLQPSKNKKHRLDVIQREMMFYVPVDFYKIPLEKFVELRSDYRFEKLRRNFVDELNLYLDLSDKNASEVDFHKVADCRSDIHGLLKEVFLSCASVAVGMHSFKSATSTGIGTLDFWGNFANTGICLDTLKQHSDEAKRYASKIKGKKQVRKYLAQIEQLWP